MNPLSLRQVLVGAAFAVAAIPALAQSSAPPLRLIVPTAPASGADLIARAAQPSISKALGGRTVVVENLSGAGGVAGTTQLVRAAPDGNTVAIISVNHVLNAHVYKKMPYDSLNDITPITGLGSIPLIMLVNPVNTPVKDARELGALLRDKPGQLNYSSPGNGAAPHLAARMFTEAAGADVRHIPYRGTGPQVTAVISGDVAFTVISASGARGFIDAGTLRPVAVMSAKRLASMPELPSIVELGYPSAQAEAWFGMVGPAKMKAEDVAALNVAFVKAFETPEVKKAMDAQMNVIQISSPTEWATVIRKDFDRYRGVIQSLGLSVD